MAGLHSAARHASTQRIDRDACSLKGSMQTGRLMFAVQVSGAGFAALIAAAGYNLAAGYAAARRRDIAAHQRCMVRMVGLAYGVFPFKHLYVVLASFFLPGHWAYAAAVWLSSPTGEPACALKVASGDRVSRAQMKCSIYFWLCT